MHRHAHNGLLGLQQEPAVEGRYWKLERARTDSAEISACRPDYWTGAWMVLCKRFKNDMYHSNDLSPAEYVAYDNLPMLVMPARRAIWPRVSAH